MEQFDAARIGQELARWREAHGVNLSQRRLAQRAGVSATTIGKIERGLRKPSPAMVARLARAVGEDPSELLRRLGYLDEVGKWAYEPPEVERPLLDSITDDLRRAGLDDEGVRTVRSLLVWALRARGVPLDANADESSAPSAPHTRPARNASNG